jgi:hypothetical protein
MRLSPLVVLLSILVSGRLFAQGFSEGDPTDRKHRDFSGKPCLETSGVARALASNPHIMNHAVSLKNHCAERIKVKICYYKSDECTNVDVPGNSEKEQVIGVFPAMLVFRYEVKEQF